MTRQCKAAVDTYEFPELALMLNLNTRLSTLPRDLERPVLLITLDLGVLEFATNETLGIEDTVGDKSVI